MRVIGTIILWIGTLLLAALAALVGALALNRVSETPYFWAFFGSVALIVLAALWVNPLVRSLLKQRGRLVSLFVVPLVLLGLAVLGFVGTLRLANLDPEYRFRNVESRLYSEESQTVAEAEAVVEHLCNDKKLAVACTAIGNKYDDGLYGKATAPLDTVTKARAYGFLKKGCELGDWHACGLMYYSSPSPRIPGSTDSSTSPGNIEKERAAVELARRACELVPAGAVPANDAAWSLCFYAGRAYLDPRNGIEVVAADAVIGRRLLDRACNEGKREEACRMLGPR